MLELKLIIRLRWLAALGQSVLILSVWYAMNREVSVLPLFAVVAILVTSNLVLEIYKERLSKAAIGPILLCDTGLLTLLLYFSGGASNPFSLFYIVHVALAALLLGERWSWILTAISSVLFGVLFVFYVDVPKISSHAHHEHNAFSLHLQGMWVAFSMVASILAFTFSRLLRAIGIRDSQLEQARNLQARQERLAAITCLAASAAHEINTPLNTIALAAGEMQKALKYDGASLASIRDADLICSEVKRCSDALSRFRAAAGDVEGEMPQEFSCGELLMDLKRRFRSEDGARIHLGSSEKVRLFAPRTPLVEALGALVSNALEVSGTEPVTLSISNDSSQQRIIVADKGPGIPAQLKSKLGEPFVSTKGPGRGLGIFLAKACAERISGKLEFESLIGVGTIARLELPATYGS